MALEKAIFGNVDWNDVDTVAPTFISFVDSVVSMESIMDLPSNVAFEIVDILKDKMLGNIYVNVAEARGIGSTLWGWITYPFSWWSSNEDDKPITEQLVASTTYGPYDNIEVGKHNVTVWCNDQTCTTMKCDKHGCRNNTCNIYDTNLIGECREYHTDVQPEEPISSVSSTESVLKPIDDNKITEGLTNDEHSTKSPYTSTTETVEESTKNQNIAERPLQLEVVLSSSVTEKETTVYSNDEASALNKQT
ncbi:unnamed protein product [Chilo suppressalis]|uniref:Uncharacterized protein n=1 Tax=Chilo suppressalis TaxID=168631 RepID=A0ABN8ARJ1_CHISP|nr:unnamed protein product [Chilo suppressalis]